MNEEQLRQSMQLVLARLWKSMEGVVKVDIDTIRKEFELEMGRVEFRKEKPVHKKARQPLYVIPKNQRCLGSKK